MIKDHKMFLIKELWKEKKTQAGWQPTLRNLPLHCTQTLWTNSRGGFHLQRGRSEMPIPSWSYLLSECFCKECISLAIPCVSTAQQICCAAELRLHGLTRSREEVSCQWGQYFHIVSVRSMGVLKRRNFTFQNRERAKGEGKERW